MSKADHMLDSVGRTSVPTIGLVIVEDNKLIRLGLSSLIHDDPRIELLANMEDAETGVEAVKSLKPDVVLMDITLPGKSGIEATQEIKDFDKTIKVIIYSCHNGEEEVIATLGSGADAYCIKDNNPDKLMDIIHIVYSGESWLDPSIASVAMDILRHPGGVKTTPAETEQTSAKLTERELEVLKCITEGKSNVEIANQLFISVNTAKEHVSNIMKKLAVQDRVQAAVRAIKEGIVD